MFSIHFSVLTRKWSAQEKHSKDIGTAILKENLEKRDSSWTQATAFEHSLLYRLCGSFLLLVLLLFGCENLLGQITTGTVFGTVKDTTGAMIPGASITLTNPAIHFSRTVTTNKTGDFVAPDLPTGDYAVTASAKGFSKQTQTGVRVDVGARLRLAALVLKVGASAETVTVEANGGAMQMQAESGERSALLDKKQIDSIEAYSGNILEYLKVLPGINSTFNGKENDKGGLDSMNFNGTRGNAHALNVDGIANEDNGTNGATQVSVNTGAIGTAKVLTSNFQAEYGKASGGQIALEIQKGTSEFHGGADYHFRHEWLNANSWFNNQTNAMNKEQGISTRATTPIYRVNNLGIQVGGPVDLPFLKNSNLRKTLFFFFSYENIQQTIPGGTTYLTVPTDDEIAGNFANSKDGNGNQITIKDPTTGLPFANDQIPSGQILSSMQQILQKIYPKPNTTDPSGFNHYNYMFETSYTHPRKEEIARVDWQINPKERLFGHFLDNQDSQGCPLGCDGVDGTSNFKFPGGMHMNEPGYNTAIDLTSTLNDTTVNEITAGWAVNKLQVSAPNGNIYTSTWNLSVPLLYSVSPDTPIPDFSFGGINNQSLPWTYLGSMPFNNALTVININDNFTKILGRHTVKAGVFMERSRKDQSAWGNMNGMFGFDGQDKAQTLQTGNPFANALLGYYANFKQSSSRLRGFYRYTQLDFYLQDTWKVNNRLTLDYGMRFPWFQPQYDARYQMAVFNPAAFSASNAPRIYWGINNGANAFDPKTPGTLVSGALAKMLVPNSGDTANGISLARSGYYKGGVQDKGFLFEPRVGFAYDLTGKGKDILRGGFGISHDRFQGNPVYNGVVTDPPNVYTPSLKYGTIQDLASLGSNSGLLAPSEIMGFEPSGKIPTVYSYSLGIQKDLGMGVMLDVAYVGNRQTHLSQKANLNSSPYGQTFQTSAQNPYSYGQTYGGTVPSSCDSSWEPAQYKAAGFNCMGTNAQQQIYLNHYQGWGTIDYYLWNGIGNYNSLQTSLNRRFGKLFTFGGSYTWSKTMDMTDSDGSWINTINPKTYNYQLAGFDRASILAANYVFNMPKFSKYLGGSRILSYIVDGYQVTGITQLISGSPAGFTNFNPWYNYMIDGSWSEPTAIYLKQGAHPVVSRRGRYAAIDPNAFQMPNIGAPTPWPKQILRNGGTNDTDLGVHKQFSLSGQRSLELRMDAFNVFNHPQFYGRNLSMNPDTADDTTGSNANNFWGWAWNWSNVQPVSPANIRPAGNKKNLGNYFGDYSGGGNERWVELTAKIHF